jgi:hypothetical protein
MVDNSTRPLAVVTAPHDGQTRLREVNGDCPGEDGVETQR